ncbi:hypothetical protein [Kineococcus sp. SYSU DK003]|uniref:hypothetical protein n=1 Tax=Kineococcus sp. SYSU DK003 TaxID=3383124 RepID=UPI003D7C420D
MSTPHEPDLPGEDSGFDFDAEFAKAFGPKAPVRSALVVPVANAKKLAEVCTLAEVHAHVVPVKGLGCVLVTEDPGTGEQDAQTLSRLVQGAEIVLLTVGEESIEGQTWRSGERGEDPRPGLLLSVWPDLVQQLVLGRVDPAEAAGAAASGEGSRRGAFWRLLRGKDDDQGDSTPA